jgi:long-chain acyl-CoA synthetase
MTMSRRDVEALLVAQGAPFEVAVEEVRGIPTRVYRRRLSSLRSLVEAAEARGDQPFLVQDDVELSYGAFVAACKAWSAAFASGPGSLAAGDRLAVLAANCPGWCTAFWATVAGGAVLVGLNGWWAAPEILHGLKDSGASVLVADRERYERVAGLLGECPELRIVYLLDASPDDVGRPGGAVVLLPAPPLQGDGTPLWSEPIDEDDPAVIFYTSGTTGAAKGVVSTHRSMLASVQNALFLGAVTLVQASTDTGAAAAGAGGEQPVVLLTTPLFHVAGCHSCMVVSFAAGTRLVMSSGRFDADTVAALIERERVQLWAAVPAMVRELLAGSATSHDLSSVRSIVFGGSPCGPDLREKIAAAFPSARSVGNAYGLTETSSVATFCSEEDAVGRHSSVGRPLPVVEVKIVEPFTPTPAIAGVAAFGEPGAKAAGEVGEICVAGSILMAGYWGDPDSSEHVLSNGWFRTGDLGHFDEEGFLFVDDRAKDVVIRGGENVYCVEVEERLASHPLVLEAAVFGSPHEILGEEVEAVVVVEAGAGAAVPDAAELQAWVAEALARFKVPARITVRSEPLPRNASGKVLKGLLRRVGPAQGSSPGPGPA